jgi:putative flippase GtrA
MHTTDGRIDSPGAQPGPLTGAGSSVPSPPLPAQRSFLASFSRSQITSAFATAVDFGLLFSLVEVGHVWYVLATALGALAGAITNFLLNRHWSFDATHGKWEHQAVRYSLVSGGSLLLNSGGVWVVTAGLGIHYAVSVVVVSMLVGVAFNYPLQRYFVFK